MTSKDNYERLYKRIEDEDEIDRLVRETMGYRDFVRCEACRTTPCNGGCINCDSWWYEARRNVFLLAVLAAVVALVWWTFPEPGPAHLPDYVAPHCAGCVE